MRSDLFHFQRSYAGYPAAISRTALTSSSASSSVLYGANPTLIQPPIRVYAHPVGERFRVIIPIGGKDAVGVGYAQASMEAPHPESGVRAQMMGIILSALPTQPCLQATPG